MVADSFQSVCSGASSLGSLRPLRMAVTMRVCTAASRRISRTSSWL
jgi:hypothetical protein